MSVSVQQRRRLEAAEVERLDPYVFMAVIGKRVIHPGGRAATEQLLKRAAISANTKVLDVGCGVGTTAITVAERFGADVTAVDIEPLMLQRAEMAVEAAEMEDRVHVREGDILALDLPDDAFDVVIAEAVTMFVDRSRAARELIRVCRPGGRVLATELRGVAHQPRKRARSSSAKSARDLASTRRTIGYGSIPKTRRMQSAVASLSLPAIGVTIPA